MMKKLVKQLLMLALAITLFCVPTMTASATEAEEEATLETDVEDEATEDIEAEEEATEETETEDEAVAEEREATPLTFEIAIFTYEILPEATQADMPTGFTIGDWEYNGVEVQAGFTENSDMICVMGQDWETGYKYRFIYDPNSDLFVPYFGADIKNGYIYTIPMYEEAEVPYGFVDAYFVIQTVPMFTYMRSDAELTQEEIAVGSLSEDNYLVFLMMDENGKEVHYTYDLIDRTFQRALLQKKDAEKVTELNEVIDELHLEIGELNAIHAERMNGRLTVIGVLIAAIVIMAGVIVNLLLKVSKLKKSKASLTELEEDDDDFGEEAAGKGLVGFFKKKEEAFDESDDFGDGVFEDEDEEDQIEVKKVIKTPGRTTITANEPETEEDDLEILDLDLDDL